MSLEIFKRIKIRLDSENFLRIFLGLVFLSAGFFRILNSNLAVLEFINLRLPGWLSPIMIIFELGAGLGLLVNRYSKKIYYSLSIFLVIVLAWAFIIDGQSILNQAGELFVFNLNPTDWFLHFIFLLLAIFLLAKERENRKN